MLAILRLSVNFFPMLLKENFLRLTFVRSTVKTRQFLCLTANFFSVLQLRVNLIETVSKNTSANKEITHCIEFIKVCVKFLFLIPYVLKEFRRRVIIVSINVLFFFALYDLSWSVGHFGSI